ncbi:MAG TPA: alpha/beta fold hydrolase [Candidatus Limnocylindrales bacterium]|nr:alpha/beta fold hydrolase [Candidatus Limnocylindrales bacterium]
MAETFHRTFFLRGPAGKLEATLWTAPAAEPSLAALVCHPHPLYGGTLHNKVVFQTAKALNHRGIPVLRFNFRGAGLSEGKHDSGRGEQDDVRAALDFLAGEFPERPILLAGFSFGAWVGLRAGCEDARVQKLIGLGIPVANLDMSYLKDCGKPKLLIQGGDDQFGPRKGVEEFFATLREPKKLVIVERADHFFSGHLAEIGRAIGAWLDQK